MSRADHLAVVLAIGGTVPVVLAVVLAIFRALSGPVAAIIATLAGV